MMMIQISEGKREKLADFTEKILHYAGKMMQCVEALDSDGEGYGERSYGGGRYGERSMGRMGMRADEDFDPDMDEMYGERRGRNGRYIRNR